MPEILNHFGIRYYKGLVIGNCPIHNGDNCTAFNINTDISSEFCGRWFCNTQGCHKKYGGDIFGFIRGMLENNNKASFIDCIKFCQEIAGSERIDFFDDKLNDFFIKKDKKQTNLTRDQVISRLEIPCEYYINRGFSKEVLIEFDVGLCTRQNVEMSNRVVFPVYDETWKYCIGCVGRSIDNNEKRWKNQAGFKSSDYLFNYWRGFEYCCRFGCAILVEGQGDVMRLWEAGHQNVFGLFGSQLSDSQESFLQRMGITNIITIADNDQAGNKLRSTIEKRLNKLFNIKHIIPPTKDVGEMTIKEIKDLSI